MPALRAVVPAMSASRGLSILQASLAGKSKTLITVRTRISLLARRLLEIDRGLKVVWLAGHLRNRSRGRRLDCVQSRFFLLFLRRRNCTDAESGDCRHAASGSKHGKSPGWTVSP